MNKLIQDQSVGAARRGFATAAQTDRGHRVAGQPPGKEEMTQEPVRLYLELLKKTLSFTLWPEPPTPIKTFNHLRPPLKRTMVSTISRFLDKRRIQIVYERVHNESQRTEGNLWPGYADTMIGLKRLDNIQYCVETALKDGIPGDLIETGVWRGGACIFMRGILAAHGVTDRKVFVADSFEGLPKPDPSKYPADKNDDHHLNNPFLGVSQEAVENNFRRYGLLDEQVVFLKGWFKDTLPQAPLEKVAVLRLDGDMYGSTIESLNNLYPKLSSGGFCIIDDYAAVKGCGKAVEDYRSEHGIKCELKGIDPFAKYWRKE